MPAAVLVDFNPLVISTKVDLGIKCPLRSISAGTWTSLLHNSSAVPLFPCFKLIILNISFCLYKCMVYVCVYQFDNNITCVLYSDLTVSLLQVQMTQGKMYPFNVSLNFMLCKVIAVNLCSAGFTNLGIPAFLFFDP